ncbi:DUF1816 domain-containing protein [Anabaena sp. UHCC 0451]|uniref:DUF1816 domain-containing protein n=1 Tax=Anabaena sp. UHCC 0451 TaxID=2055235 RepID=UPI002B2174D1|nr:DUF1816 domain-containing protein [Anabaena sp. UHCC 0451]MEA5576294.1 DUF1816 domain-containing protein [Anabaena sp. UHCC 0451]
MNLFPSQQSDVAWWVEINTVVPHCTYYFGPFDSEKEAQLYRTGYVEDLYQEEARGIVALVKQCRPDVLTIFHEEAKVKIFSF